MNHSLKNAVDHLYDAIDDNTISGKDIFEAFENAIVDEYISTKDRLDKIKSIAQYFSIQLEAKDYVKTDDLCPDDVWDDFIAKDELDINEEKKPNVIKLQQNKGWKMEFKPYPHPTKFIPGVSDIGKARFKALVPMLDVDSKTYFQKGEIFKIKTYTLGSPNKPVTYRLEACKFGYKELKVTEEELTSSNSFEYFHYDANMCEEE